MFRIRLANVLCAAPKQANGGTQYYGACEIVRGGRPNFARRALIARTVVSTCEKMPRTVAA